jgi:hypothetical protein
MAKTSTLFTKPRLNGGKHTNPNRDEASLRREIEAGVKYFWARRGGYKGYSRRGGAL